VRGGGGGGGGGGGAPPREGEYFSVNTVLYNRDNLHWGSGTVLTELVPDCKGRK
jgi:hypothetical protein